MRKSGIDHIDNELIKLKSKFQYIVENYSFLSDTKNANKEAKCLKSEIQDFRYKLAYNRGTEFYETKYKWAGEFKLMLRKLEIIIENTKIERSS